MADDAIVFHIRHRLPRRGGNQFYRDRSPRVARTLCGAPVTEFDAGWGDHAVDWVNSDGQAFSVCAECRRVRDALHPAKRPLDTFSLRYFYSGETYYMGMRGGRMEGGGSVTITKPHSGTYSRRVKAKSLVAAYRKLRRSVRRRAASVRSIRLIAAWSYNAEWRTAEGQIVGEPWHKIGDHRYRWEDQ